uniref:Uncharacterized protein n=1 Tax=Schistosoma japonicum TaxID=6182 RepID=Q5C4Y1_SCHJA|nr:unknown [Schistosoma japonicum]
MKPKHLRTMCPVKVKRFQRSITISPLNISIILIKK